MFRPGFLQPPTRRAGSIPQGGGCTADAHFLIKGLAYGVKTPLPSPTPAPTLAHTGSCQLPAPCTRSKAAGAWQWEAEAACSGAGSVARSARLPSSEVAGPLSDATETVTDKRSHYFHFHCSVISASTWNPPGRQPQPAGVGGGQGKKRSSIALREASTPECPHPGPYPSSVGLNSFAQEDSVPMENTKPPSFSHFPIRTGPARALSTRNIRVAPWYEINHTRHTEP